MPCSLSEAWAVAYFLAAVSILIFGLGFPALIQVFIPEDMRSIVKRHQLCKHFYFYLIALIIFINTVVAMIFIWILHPNCNAGHLDYIASRFKTLLTIYGINNINRCYAGGILITLAIIVLLYVWYLQLSYLKGNIIIRLKNKCMWRIWWNGRINPEIISDIQYLGEHGKSAGEKIQVLNVLESIAKRVQDHKRYQGSELEEIIKAFEFIMKKDPDVDSFIEGIEVLKRIVGNIIRLNLGSSADAGLLLRTFQRLGSVAFAWDDVRPARKMLEAVDFFGRNIPGAFPMVALILLELGKEALARSRFLVAGEALSQLEAITWPRQPLDSQNAAAYLGLIAHFWSKEGSARQKAESSLDGVVFSRPRDCIREARIIHFNATRFDTADKLAQMLLP
jgi:hypothetical protein